MKSVSFGFRCAGSGDLTEHRAVGKARTARIVEPENPSHQLAGGVEAGDLPTVGIEHLAVRVDLQAAEAEGDAAGHRVGFEWSCVQRVGPVRLIDLEALRAPP